MVMEVLVVLEGLVVIKECIFERVLFYFIFNIIDHKPLPTGSVAAVAVGKRASVYLDQSHFQCIFLD